AGATAFAPATSTLGAVMPWISGAAAIFHGVQGIRQVWTETDDSYYSDTRGQLKYRTPREYAVGAGNLITAGGFAALAFGLGPWALPIIAIGQAAALAGQHFGRDS
ncbi:MAG: hypothetical protein AB1758_32475, partial [Candidatus Eremiobacterota bacterium]